MKSNLFALIGEEFSLEARAALEELTANMALIIKVITTNTFFLSFIPVYSVYRLFPLCCIISLGSRFSNFFVG